MQSCCKGANGPREGLWHKEAKVSVLRGVELRGGKDDFQLGQSVMEWPVNRLLTDFSRNDCWETCFAGDRNGIGKKHL